MSAEVRAGRIRPLPIALLIQQLIGPVVVHMLSRPMLIRGVGPQLPGIHEACAVFAEAFVRAVAVPKPSPPTPVGHGSDEPESGVS